MYIFFLSAGALSAKRVCFEGSPEDGTVKMVVDDLIILHARDDGVSKVRIMPRKTANVSFTPSNWLPFNPDTEKITL